MSCIVLIVLDSWVNPEIAEAEYVGAAQSFAVQPSLPKAIRVLTTFKQFHPILCPTGNTGAALLSLAAKLAHELDRTIIIDGDLE